MNVILSMVMSGLLLIHAVLGCCWHHAHTCARHDSAAEHAEPLDTCCKDHQCPAEHEGPCNCRIECHGVCIYMTSQKVQIDCTQLVIPFEFVAIEGSFVDPQAAKPLREALGRAIAALPPLRLHLFHQILLI